MYRQFSYAPERKETHFPFTAFGIGSPLKKENLSIVWGKCQSIGLEGKKYFSIYVHPFLFNEKKHCLFLDLNIIKYLRVEVKTIFCQILLWRLCTRAYKVRPAVDPIKQCLTLTSWWHIALYAPYTHTHARLLWQPWGAHMHNKNGNGSNRAKSRAASPLCGSVGRNMKYGRRVPLGHDFNCVSEIMFHFSTSGTIIKKTSTIFCYFPSPVTPTRSFSDVSNWKSLENQKIKGGNTKFEHSIVWLCRLIFGCNHSSFPCLPDAAN